MKEQKPLLVGSPDVVVATPARALLHLQAKHFSLEKLQTIVVDEADLVFSFGYEEEIKEIVKCVVNILNFWEKRHFTGLNINYLYIFFK